MGEVFHMGLREHDLVIKVHEAGLSLDSREDHIDGPLECSGRISETEGELNIPKGFFVTGKGRIVTILEGRRDLPAPRVRVKHREDSAASFRKLMQSSILGVGYESFTVLSLSLRHSF